MKGLRYWMRMACVSLSCVGWLQSRRAAVSGSVRSGQGFDSGRGCGGALVISSVLSVSGAAVELDDVVMSETCWKEGRVEFLQEPLLPC